jgi:Leucine Rich repeats (2 copies)
VPIRFSPHAWGWSDLSGSAIPLRIVLPTRVIPLAGLTSLQTLDLSGCKQLSSDLSPLTGLTSLQTLDLSGCEQLSSDLSPLAGLTSLLTLNLSGCKQLSDDLSPLTGLTSLQTLNLNGPDAHKIAYQIPKVTPYSHFWISPEISKTHRTVFTRPSRSSVTL